MQFLLGGRVGGTGRVHARDLLQALPVSRFQRLMGGGHRRPHRVAAHRGHVQGVQDGECRRGVQEREVAVPHPAEVECLGLGGLLDDLDHLGMLRHRLHERNRREPTQQVAEPGLLARREGLAGHDDHLVGHQGTPQVRNLRRVHVRPQVQPVDPGAQHSRQL